MNFLHILKILNYLDWINNNNYNINYNPFAIVRHKHSVSTSERSDLWFTFVDRSSKIYEFLKNSNKKLMKVS